MNTNQLSETYNRLKQELSSMEGRVALLRAQIEALEMAGASNTPNPSTNGVSGDTHVAPMPVNGLKTHSRVPLRAPAGELRERILALTAKKGMTNAEIRDALSASGYPWCLTTLHVSKNLTAMVHEKKLTADGPPLRRRYKAVSK